MLRSGLNRLAASETARRLATGTRLTRAVSRRFVPGESMEEVLAAAREANGQGLGVTMNYLGESVHDAETARAATETYLALLDRIREQGLDGSVSVKLTQLGQDIDEDLLRENVERLLARAAERSVFVRFDMESSTYTERTLRFFEDLWNEGHRNVGVVLQAALHRTAGDLARMIRLGAPVRLCKGAYDEPASIAYQGAARIRRNFLELMDRLLVEGRVPAIATHDERIIRATRRRAHRAGIPPEAFEFQLLYGVRRDVQEELRSAGFRVRVYIPFGEMWYPYLMRRLAERPENVFFLAGSVLKESPLGVLWRIGNSKSPEGEGPKR